jgi:hypothetical protein
MINICKTCLYYGTKPKDEPCADCYDGRNWEDYWEKYFESDEEKAEKRPEMLPKPQGIYEHSFSRLPERIRVSFRDGSTAVYDLRVNQPAPVIVENVKIIRKWKTGYVNQPLRRRRKK